ncbi:alpha/beta hydrolase [Mycoplasmatota bacterium zrk1]
MKKKDNEKIKKKRGKKVMIIIGIILAILATLMLIGFIINSILSKDELEDIAPYGQMVDINGEKMHVYSMGDGEETIVLLPGFGVSLPSADFGPLMRELSEKHTVVAVEYFGVGFSDQTDTPRTNENYTNEIRTALEKAGFNPPYILMPHSYSGIHSEYYANKYPDEIKGIIMLDTTSSAETESKRTPSFLYSIAKFQQTVGITRLAMSLMPETKLLENGYTEKEISDYLTFNFHVINDSLVNQSDLMVDNIKEVSTLDFPSNIPVLKIISSDTIKNLAKLKKDDGMGYQTEHINRLGNNASYKIVDGSHFIYQSKAAEIVELMENFFN